MSESTTEDTADGTGGVEGRGVHLDLLIRSRDHELRGSSGGGGGGRGGEDLVER